MEFLSVFWEKNSTRNSTRKSTGRKTREKFITGFFDMENQIFDPKFSDATVSIVTQK